MDQEKLHTRPSIQYLFNRYKTGRMIYSIGGKEFPELVWTFNTRGYPPKGPESTPVFDKDSNIYFGSHDGCIYSLDNLGELRWMFKTDKKVYSSPAITETENIIIAGGDGYLYNLTNKGDLNWVYDICRGYRGKTAKVIINRMLTFKKTFDFERKRVWNIKSWSSPNIGKDNTIYITGYGIGLHAVDNASGEAKWTYDLGSPRFHLTGVAIDKDEKIYACSQQKYLHCIDKRGKLIWQKSLKSGYDLWSNPTIDPETGKIYVSANYREKKAVVYSVSKEGTIIWNTKIKGGIRGAAAISKENYVVICSLNGYVYFMDKENGNIIYEKKFSNAQRALWTTPSIDSKGNILFTTKDSNTKGSLFCIDKKGKILWHHKDIGKALSTPVLDSEGKVYIGSWKGEFVCLQT